MKRLLKHSQHGTCVLVDAALTPTKRFPRCATASPSHPARQGRPHAFTRFHAPKELQTRMVSRHAPGRATKLPFPPRQHSIIPVRNRFGTVPVSPSWAPSRIARPQNSCPCSDPCPQHGYDTAGTSYVVVVSPHSAAKSTLPCAFAARRPMRIRVPEQPFPARPRNKRFCRSWQRSPFGERPHRGCHFPTNELRDRGQETTTKHGTGARGALPRPPENHDQPFVIAPLQIKYSSSQCGTLDPG